MNYHKQSIALFTTIHVNAYSLAKILNNYYHQDPDDVRDCVIVPIYNDYEDKPGHFGISLKGNKANSYLCARSPSYLWIPDHIMKPPVFVHVTFSDLTKGLEEFKPGHFIVPAKKQCKEHFQGCPILTHDEIYQWKQNAMDAGEI